MIIIHLSTYQKIVSPFFLFISFIIPVLFAQILNFKPKWAWGVVYAISASLTAYFLFMTFYSDKYFTS